MLFSSSSLPSLDIWVPTSTTTGFARYRTPFWQTQKSGDVIEGAGGLRKVRHADARRGKGKRGGLRVIYFWWRAGAQFWLFPIYGKDLRDDLSPKERAALKETLKLELAARRKQ